MQIIDAGAQGEPFSRIYTEHNGEKMAWDLQKFYGKPTNATVAGVFELINGYWSSLPSSRQDKIFRIYGKARQCLDDIIDPNQQHIALTSVVKALYDEMPFDEIQYWARTHGNIRVPPSIKSNYSELEISDRNQVGQNYQAKTYLRDDYLELVNMALLMKPMIPIWAEYGRLLEQVSNTNSFREYRAMSLLNNSKAVGTEPMERLRRYVETASLDARTAMSAALGGIGSSELPDWLMSMVIIRKLVIIELSSYEDSNNIVSVVYHHVRNTIKSVDRKFSGRIRDKPRPRNEDDDENKSIIETYKIKQEISDGDLMVLSIYTEQTLAMTRQLSPDIPEKLVDRCLSTIREIEHQQPTEGQLTLLRWILSSVIPPRSIDNISKPSLMSCFAAAQATLWYHQQPDLALLLTAHETRDSQGYLIGGIESRSRIPKEFVDRFVELYPHYQEKGAKERERQTNVACRAIDNITKDFVKCNWVVHAPKELINMGTAIDDSKVMTAPSDIKTQLSVLVLRLAEAQELLQEQR
jgi:hypothetical protein